MSTRGERRPLVATLHRSTTPTIIMDIGQASRGHRPTQAKSLSLGEYVFLTDITFMFTHTHCQMSVLILFHCNIHASLFSFSCFLLVCLINLKKNEKKLVSLLSMLVVVTKRKPKNISRSSFACWELSRVNSFISFLFFGGQQEKTIIKLLKWLLYALLLI